MIRLPLLALIVIVLACVDPNNLSLPSRPAQGLEHKGVEQLSRNPQATVEHVRWSPRHGNLQRTPGEGPRELGPGVATGMDMLATTRPDYRSSHAFVTRAEQPRNGLTLDDGRLRSLTIGLQMAGNDAMTLAPPFVTARRGLARNAQGYTRYGNVDWSNPQAGNVNALVTARSMSRSTGGL
jgi:mxaJ protein